MSVEIQKLTAKEYDGVASEMELDLIDLFKVIERDVLDIFSKEDLKLNDIRNGIDGRFGG